MDRERRGESPCHARGLAAAAIAPLLVLAAGCLTPGYLGPGEFRPRLSSEAVLLQVSPVDQEGESDCGLACLVALLRYHGSDADEEAQLLFAPSRVEEEGIPAGELRGYLRRRGFQAVLVHGTLDEAYPQGLLGLLRREYPVIVEIVPRSSHHYVLVAGFDPSSRWVLLMDPAYGLAAIGYDDFDAMWSRADRLMLVAAPPPRAGPTK